MTKRHKPAQRLSVPETHQLRIARDTLRMSDAGALIMGGPSKAEAREIIQRLTGKPPATHSEWAARHKSSVPCTANHSRIGGGCFNCGWPGK